MSKSTLARSTVKEMMMKNILRAMALVAFGTVSLAASANAMPTASSVAGVGEQTSASVEQVGYYGRGGYGHGGYGHGGYYGHRKFYGGHYGYGRGWGHNYYGWGHRNYGWGYKHYGRRHYGYGY